MSSNKIIKVFQNSYNPLISRIYFPKPCSESGFLQFNRCLSSQLPEESKSTEVSEKNEQGRTDTISKAMAAYLQRAKDHHDFMDKQEKEFVFGRRHLANMMGKDQETFTQEDINEAIRYLFPSGLYEKLARPMMRPPQEIYPKQKAAQFDVNGRPHHPLFYTAKPNFFYILHEMVGKHNTLNALESISPVGSNISEDKDSAFAGSVWISKADLEGRLLERITDNEYTEWVACIERLANHPQKKKEIEFLKSYRKPLSKQTKIDEIPPITLEPDGKKSCFVPLLMRKTARGDLKMTVPGTGEIKINGQGLEHFKMTQSRESVIFPLQLCGWLGKVDIEAFVTGGTVGHEKYLYAGESARSGCLRWGIATAMAALGADVEKLRLAGLLTRDHRVKERNKNAHDGARAKWTWKKR